MNQRDARKLALLDRALTIAADMFAAEGYCSDYGDPNPAALSATFCCGKRGRS